MRRLFSMYGGLKREIYILCFGRFVTAMGSLIWPMLTLILKSKLGYDAEEVAMWFLLFGAIQLPFALIGGKLTDRYNKRNLIVIFDLISVALCVFVAFLPLSIYSICIYFISSVFQHMEWPAYDALIAEMSADKEREKAYSLHYLSANLGVVFAPTLGGLLFNNYLWLAFLISGLAVFSSTIFIYKFVPENIEAVKNTNMYEQSKEGTLGDILKGRKLLILFIVLECIISIIYGQFNYLLPMQMDEFFFEQGAFYFGMMTSINGFVVISCTPILTHLTIRWTDVSRIILGEFLQIIGLCACFFYSDTLICYILTMVVFTLGEVMHTLGSSPYISKRVPASHRGRYTSTNNIVRQASSSIGNTFVGKIVVLYTFKAGWIFIGCLGLVSLTLLTIYKSLDKKHFKLLY